MLDLVLKSSLYIFVKIQSKPCNKIQLFRLYGAIEIVKKFPQNISKYYIINQAGEKKCHVGSLKT